ncbi:MAG TPA: EVE domain-containing protein [Pirellulaceae bacterium]|nr:EVE domain-containing protein [Pirellulaceae bacterium]
MAHWLFKSEPNSYSIDDLAAEVKQTTFWNGMRNYQARNLMRDQIQVGDDVLFYHSSTEPAGIVGLCRIVRAAYPDHTALDTRSPYFDPKSTADNPIWMMVDIRLVRQFKSMISLAELRKEKRLANMELLRRGSRLSVQPVSASEFKTIMRIAERR